MTAVSSATWGARRTGDLWCDDGAHVKRPRLEPTIEEFLALVILLDRRSGEPSPRRIELQLSRQSCRSQDADRRTSSLQSSSPVRKSGSSVTKRSRAFVTAYIRCLA